MACRWVGVSLGILSASGAAQTQTHPLNDSGIDFCGGATSGDNKPCLGTEPAGQDSHHGPDKDAYGKGFSFTALNASGQPTTPSSGTNHHLCVRARRVSRPSPSRSPRQAPEPALELPCTRSARHRVRRRQGAISWRRVRNSLGLTARLAARR